MNQPQIGTFESIDLAAIRPSTTNPRKNFEPIALAELQHSIEEMGVTVAILVRPIEPSALTLYRYELVSGERRYRAAMDAGLDEIPAQVRELSDREAADIQMIENLNREDLHPVEEAQGYRALLASGAIAEDIAKKTGKDLAYVVKRLELLKLTPEASAIFSGKHITVGQALRLAQLTPDNQAKALCFLLGIPEWQIKKDNTHAQAAAEKVKNYTGLTWMKTAEDRLVRPTEAQLTEWIKANVLLVLKSAPWDLGDAALLPEAGACTTCPKRTGANQALFSDLTTAEDNCTDALCFAAKQKAFVAYTQEMAKDTGSPLLKLSTKHSVDKLDVAPVEMKPAGVKLKGKVGDGAVAVMKPVVVAKKTIREGQWVEAKKGSCPMVVQGVLTDGKDMGKTRYVCTDQDCKVHTHVVNKAAKPTAKAAVKVSPETAKKAADEAALLQKIETQAEKAMMGEARGKISTSQRFVERFLATAVSRTWGGIEPLVLEALNITVKGWKRGTPMSHLQKMAAHKAIEKHLVSESTPTDLHVVAFELLMHDAIDESEEDVVEELLKIAGVDAKEIRRRIELELRAEPTLKPGVKKAAAKKSVSEALSPEARQGMVDAAKERWAKRDTDEDLDEGADLVDALEENYDADDEDGEDQ